jgi:hypothetical protein
MNSSGLLSYTQQRIISSDLWATLSDEFSFVRSWGIFSPMNCIRTWGGEIKMGLEAIPIWRQK